MHKPRFLDEVAAQLGDRDAFTGHLLAGRRPFQPSDVEPQWPRDRAVDILHIKLEVGLDFERKRIAATATHRLTAIVDELKSLEFDASELEIGSVRVGKEPASFESRDGKVQVTLPRALKAGAEVDVDIEYSGAPRRGLYFVAPDSAYPDKPVEAWTQGEDEDSRYWFPCYDYPNDRATSEVIATVPDHFTAISNGALLSKTHNPAARTRTFHWRHDVPHSTYLITLAAGEFVAIEDRAGNTPVLYYVHPGREDDARRAFGNTPKMIQFFERVIGVPYPYAKYAQVAVSDFIFGGMENTSATTQTADTLHDARAHIDFKSDPLVAHELAHQWWGDLITCRDWSHAWLNEGFATYSEVLFKEHDMGREEAAYYQMNDLDNYLQEDSERYRRPIVSKTYMDPHDLFDRHLYEKGGLVLHALRYYLGDDSFQKGLQHYAITNREKVVETNDFRRALEDVTGRDLEAFFDQWVYHSGLPEFKVDYDWDDNAMIA